jgi:hypothetical protein
MLSHEDGEKYLLEYKSKLNNDSKMPMYVKSTRLAEAYVALGRHSDSLVYFEAALVRE